MHFFSKYCYIWKFLEEGQEDEYARFVMPSNLAYLRLVSFITIFGMLLFLIIDFFKDVDFSTILGVRSVALIVASFTMMLSYKRELSVRTIFACIALLVFTNFGIAMATALYANMPPYYITNLLFLLFVLVVTASGLNFRHAFWLNISFMAVFIFFSQVVKREPFYFSQYPHLFSILIYILIVGMVLENRRRLGFLNFKELEKQKKIVETLNQQKNKIISILSHDIAAPLNSLTGLLSLQTRGMVSADQIGPYVSQVGERIENVQLLLQSLMRWSKSQIDGFVPDKKKLNVSEVISETCKQFSSQLKEKSLELIISNEEMHCLADRDMVTLVFRNMLSNAIKFSKLNASIEISISRSGDDLIIKFLNYGDPIPEELKPKLFTYHIQSAVGTAGEKGTGLGLAMSAYFVQLNGGRVYLQDSQLGEVVFCVALPAADSGKS